MFGTLVALIALVVFILPGFLTSRLATGRLAAPAGLGDLELVLRALGYSLVLHTAFALTGWTGSIVESTDESGEWSDHVPELAAFAALLLVAATVLGMLLSWGLERLQPLTTRSRMALNAFHALGGQDVRDAFDYIFERRKRDGEDFMAVVHTEGPDSQEWHYGRYGDDSYFGLSPRPHDLFLEEVWVQTGEDELKPKQPHQGVWFAADAIRSVRFRPLPAEDKQRGTTRTLGRFDIASIEREQRRRIAREIASAIIPVVGDPDDAAHVLQTFRTARQRVEEAVRDAANDGATVDESYRNWQNVRHELVELGAAATALAAEEGEFHRSERWIASAVEQGRLRLRVPSHPVELWLARFAYLTEKLAEEGSRSFYYSDLMAMVIDEIDAIDNAEWDFPRANEV